MASTWSLPSWEGVKIPIQCHQNEELGLIKGSEARRNYSEHLRASFNTPLDTVVGA